jgi:hypothetical protein
MYLRKIKKEKKIRKKRNNPETKAQLLLGFKLAYNCPFIKLKHSLTMKSTQNVRAYF